MSRARKLLIVSFVLALGIGLAWPYRKNATIYLPESRSNVIDHAVGDSATAFDQPAAAPANSFQASPAANRHVVAKMASTADSLTAGSAPQGFDLENHAVVSRQQDDISPTTSSPPQFATVPKTTTDEKPSARPAYSTAEKATVDQSVWPEELVHIVRNGDTLEKLAERYLGDEGRALELFDLNRDQLTNPHLLPIDAELRIPITVRRQSD